MITSAQTDILTQEDTQRTILLNIDADPVKVALQIKENGALISTQIKYLQKAKSKLPSYYAARCIIEPLAYEQSSSEQAASVKVYGGELCIDLTCGMGVDSYYLSKKFDRVTAIERNPELCKITRENFRRLGCGNIELHNTSAEEFIEGFDQVADLIYIDPARRSDSGSKLYLLEHCSPDVKAMLPALMSKTKRLVIKASPLFDISEAFRIFGNGITVEAISVAGECKELVIDIDTAEHNTEGRIKATAVGIGTIEFDITEAEAADFNDIKKNYLIIPDVTLYKTRKVKAYAAREGFCCTSDTGYCYAEEKPEKVFGRARKIAGIFPYQPKKLKQMLSEAGVRRADILKKDFPHSAAAIAKALGIAEGGRQEIAFTRIKNELYTIILDDDDR